MHGGDRFADPHRVAGFLVQFQADGVVDDVVLFVAAAAQNQAGQPHLLALNALDETIRVAAKSAR